MRGLHLGLGFNRGFGASIPTYLPTVSASPQAVYGTRKMVEAYAGPCCKVNRASDNAQLDIGFVNNVIDMASANTFRGVSEITVVTWYDQSGNGLDATNATVANQPRLRSQNAWRGLQGITFDGVGTSSGGTVIAKTLAFPAGVTVDRQSQTAFMVNSPKGSYNSNCILEIGTTTGTRATPFCGNGASFNGMNVLTGATSISGDRFLRSNPSVNAWRMSPTAAKVIVDNTGAVSQAAITAGSASGGKFGATASGTAFNASGEVYSLVVYASPLNDTEVSDVKAAIESIYSISYDQTASVVLEGDSITYGTSDSFLMNNIRQCYPDLIKDVHIYNMAVHGTTAAVEYPRRVSKFNGVDRAVSKKVFVIGLGSNDINNSTSASDLWSLYILPYIQYAQSRGYQVIVGTIIPRSGFSAPQEVERLAYNALVLANAATYSYSVADYCAEPEFDAQADAGNTTYYYTDGVHPITAGYSVMKSVLCPVINTLI